MTELLALRHHLHRHPEVSQNEYNTQKHLLHLFKNLSIDHLEKVANTGLLLHFKGKEAGVNILFRGDMDALPIEETITTGYRSATPGISHKCGHDGHTTILFGLAKHYADSRPESGDVFLFFQPAEENGWGAKALVESNVLPQHRIDMVFALHNLPGYPLHKIVCREGSFTSSVVSLAANFKGYTAHAAEPWNGRNPAKAMSMFLLDALEENIENKPQHEFVTVTPVYSELGSKAYGISAGEGTVHLTIRADIPQRMEAALKKIEATAKSIAAAEELEVTFEYIEPFDANMNAREAVKIIQQSAESLSYEMEERPEPFRWGEDFGLLTNRYPGAMFGVGSGEDCYPLHHPAYDFPDAILETGINMFITIQKEAQKQ